MLTEKYFAPGRINLIGEHLDYNGGWVLPIAINKGITATVHRRKDGLFRLSSEGHDFVFEGSLDPIQSYDPMLQWTNYPLGVLNYLQEHGEKFIGASIHFESNLPEGSGLSSSAAIEVITAYLTVQPLHQKIDRVELALLCQKVENHFIGVKCGIMDQFAVANAERDHAILLNCETLEYRQVPFELGDYSLVVMNTCNPRTLIKSAYNARKQECELALTIFQKRQPEIAALAQAPMELLQLINDDVLMRRARHVISEQLRVKHSVQALENGDLHTFGRLMTASHQSLKNDYEVTGPELDVLAETAQNVEGCLGARMTGAGFGGCAIALVRKTEVVRFTEVVTKIFERKFGTSCQMFETNAGRGVYYF
ncbi:MAG: galactokinase [Chitinophagales bacterium]